MRVYWPETPSSGVTLGIGYDLGSRSTEGVLSDLVSAGMSQEQANIISEAAGASCYTLIFAVFLLRFLPFVSSPQREGLKGELANQWVAQNRDQVGVIEESVVRSLFSTQFPAYTDEAKTFAIDVNPSPGLHALNARSRELAADPPKDLYTYVMKEDQWNNLHPAMIELITDLKFHGGFYAYDRIAKINEVLIAHDGDHLEQFRSVAALFGSQGGNKSYMDTYALAVGLTGGNTETFYGIPAVDIVGATERRNRIRLSFLMKVIKTLESGSTVEMIEPAGVTGPNDCTTTNPHDGSTCSPGPNGCFTPRAEFVRGAIVSCFPNEQQQPTTYLGHSGQGNSMDAWHKSGGYQIEASDQVKEEMDALAMWLMTHHADLKLSYMIWYNRIWNPIKDEFGVWWDCGTPVVDSDPPQYRCACMSDGSCEDISAGHYDHLHLTVLH